MVTPVSGEQSKFEVSPSDWGGVGLLQTRTARFSKDGQLDIGISLIDQYLRYEITLQPLPRLEATFRYTDIANRLFSNVFEFSRDQTFKDRGADLKFLVLRESEWFPQLAIGMQDSLGTGLFSGEYVVASKQFFDFDLSLGMGWGYFSSGSTIKNPLTSLATSFATRSTSFGQGGSLDVGSWFSGANVGIFGGVEYFTPIRGVSLKMEFDPNDYQNEPISNVFPQKTHINFGVNLKPYPWLNLAVAYERGNRFMFRTSLTANLMERGLPKIFDSAPVMPSVRDLTAAAPLMQSLPQSIKRPKDSNANQVDGIDTATAQLFQYIAAKDWYVDEVALLGSEARLRLGGRHSSARVGEIAPYIFAAFPQATSALIGFTDSSVPPILVERLATETNELEKAFDIIEDTLGPVNDISIADNQIILQVGRRIPNRPSDNLAMMVWPFVPRDINEMIFVGDSEAGIVHIFVRPIASKQSNTRAASRGSGKILADAAVLDGQAVGMLDHQARTNFAEAVIEGLESENFIVDGIEILPSEVFIYVAGGTFRQQAKNLGRALRIVTSIAPKNIEYITIVQLSHSVEINRVRFNRRAFENALVGRGSLDELWKSTEIQDPKYISRPPGTILNPNRYPYYSWYIRPKLRQHIGSPDGFYIYQLWLAAAGSVELAPNFNLRATVGKNVYSGFDRLRNPGESNLPRVRSLIKDYLREGRNNLVRLQADYVGMIVPDLYYRLSGGMFEEFFGGYGAELLYRPRTGRLAVGVDLSYVRQRAFTQLLDFRDYTVATGHLNIYYDVPWQDLFASVHIGQFLAGDRGANYRLARRFDSGVVAGGWFTLTNVSFEVFGEGSFDKGFFIMIPFDLFSLKSSRRVGLFGFRPLTKDGGQMLNVVPRLYDVVGGGRDAETMLDWPHIME